MKPISTQRFALRCGARALMLTFGIGVSSIPCAFAQEAILQPAVRETTISLRNIKPSLMAWWLDPKRQPTPSEIRVGFSLNDQWPHASNQPRGQGNVLGPKKLELPQGIESISANDAQSLLKARGSEAGLEKLKLLVNRWISRFLKWKLKRNSWRSTAKFCPN